MSQKPPVNPLLNTRGRAAASNTTSRFDKNVTTPDFDNSYHIDSEDQVVLRTRFLKDTSRTILTSNDSPDLPFSYTMNFYRGCEHGCIYCYARPTHEYLGLSAGLDFESKIFVKEEAPQLLREAFMKPGWKPQSIMMSGATDCYQPAERKFELTRKCLEVLRDFKHPVSIVTKNNLITRDLDILAEMAKDDLVFVFLSITTLDAELARVLEPRTSSPEGRLSAIRALKDAGVAVGVNVAPIIPGLTDHELPNILKAAREAGAEWSGYTLLRLPYSVSTLFTEWLDVHRPLAKDKVLNYIRDLRGGKLNSAEFGDRMRGNGPRAENMKRMFNVFSDKFGFNQRDFQLRTDAFQRPGDQMTLDLF